MNYVVKSFLVIFIFIFSHAYADSSSQASAGWQVTCKDGLQITLSLCKDNLDKEKTVFKVAFYAAYAGTEIERMVCAKHGSLDHFLDLAFDDEIADFTAHKPNTLFMVAKTQTGQPVGFISFDKTVDEHNEPCVYIRQDAILPTFQRKDIGTAITHAYLNVWPTIYQMKLVTRRLNRTALLFYLTLGFSLSAYSHTGYDPNVYVGLEKTFDDAFVKSMLNKYKAIQTLEGTTWQELLKQKASEDLYHILKEQCTMFAKKRLPSIAAPEIKSIIIQENNEPLIDVREMHNSRITMLPDAPTAHFIGPQYNAGFATTSKVRLGLWRKLEKVPQFLDELAESFGYKPGTITIKIFEGLRDLNTQAKLLHYKIKEILIKEILEENPAWSEQAVETEAAKWVSPVKNNIPVHSTGAAVDLRLWNTETNDFVDLGNFGIIWGPSEGAPTFSECITETQKFNRLYLLMAATKAGLVNYPYEYWHFSTGDRVAAYWSEKDTTNRSACYGGV